MALFETYDAEPPTIAGGELDPQPEKLIIIVVVMVIGLVLNVWLNGWKPVAKLSAMRQGALQWMRGNELAQIAFIVSMLSTVLLPFLAGLLRWPLWVPVLVGAWSAYSYISTRWNSPASIRMRSIEPLGWLIPIAMPVVTTSLMIGAIFFLGYGIGIYFD